MLLLTSVSSTPMELWGQDGSWQHSPCALTAHSWSSPSRILSLHIPRELKGVCKFRSKAPCSSALTQTCTERPKPCRAGAFTPCWADCDAVASCSALRLCPLPSLFHATFAFLCFYWCFHSLKWPPRRVWSAV